MYACIIRAEKKARTREQKPLVTCFLANRTTQIGSVNSYTFTRHQIRKSIVKHTGSLLARFRYPYNNLLEGVRASDAWYRGET